MEEGQRTAEAEVAVVVELQELLSQDSDEGEQVSSDEPKEGESNEVQTPSEGPEVSVTQPSAIAEAQTGPKESAEVFPSQVKSTKPLTVSHGPHLHSSPHHHDHPVPSVEERVDISKGALRESRVKSKKPLTVPHAPKLSTSNRKIRTVTTTTTTTTDRKSEPKPSTRRPTAFVPTIPQAPKLSTSNRTSIRSKADVMGGKQETKPSTKPSATGAENHPPSRVNRVKKNAPTVPVGPKLMLDAKHGEKKMPSVTSEASSSAKSSLTTSAKSSLTTSAKSNLTTSAKSSLTTSAKSSLTSSANSRRPSASITSASTKNSRRQLTVPVGPKFLLDKKYGEKVSSAASVTSEHSAGSTPTYSSFSRASNRHHFKHNLGDTGSDNDSPLRKNRTKKGLTVPVGPKFLLDAKYGEKKASISHDGASHSSNAHSPPKGGRRLSAGSESTTSTRSSRRPLTVPIGPKFLLDKKYGEKPMSVSHAHPPEAASH